MNKNEIENPVSEDLFIQAAPRAPKNTKSWPQFPERMGFDVVFKPYGLAGRGYYYKRNTTLG